jgi:hypothetical protein
MQIGTASTPAIPTSLELNHDIASVTGGDVYALTIDIIGIVVRIEVANTLAVFIETGFSTEEGFNDVFPIAVGTYAGRAIARKRFKIDSIFSINDGRCGIGRGLINSNAIGARYDLLLLGGAYDGLNKQRLTHKNKKL